MPGALWLSESAHQMSADMRALPRHPTIDDGDDGVCGATASLASGNLSGDKAPQRSDTSL